MFVARPLAEDSRPEPKRAREENWPSMDFFKEDKVETVQSHDDSLVVTLKIGDMMLGG